MVNYAAETNRNPIDTDHFWITIQTGHPGLLRISINTFSKINARAGFDPRMRIGVVASTWTKLPAAGVFKCPGLDYGDLEAKDVVTYVEYERPRALLRRRVVGNFVGFATGERNSFDPQQFSTGVFHDCRPTGKGDRAD
jgi:hypothetical protein